MKRVSWTNVGAALLALWIGATCAVQGQEPGRLVFIGLSPIVPTQFLRGLWFDSQSCLQRWDTSIDALRFAVADYIIDREGEDGPELLWGVYANVAFTEGSAVAIVVERSVRYSARVWSHEFGHAIGNLPDGDWKLGVCTLYEDNPAMLPLRPLTDEQLAGLLATTH